MGSLAEKTGRFLKKTQLIAKQNGPTIMVVSGVISMFAGCVYVAAKSKKNIQTVEDAKEDLKIIREYKNAPEKRPAGYTEKDVQKDLTRIYFSTAGKLLLTNAPAIAAELAGGALILGGTKIINDRLAITSAALSTALGEFEEYRKKAIEKFGENGEKIDAELRYGLKEGEVKEEEVDENGKTKKVKKKVYYINEEFGENGYRRMFDFKNPYWDGHPDYNLLFLSAKQNYFNDKLRADGFVFLNDVLKELGFETTRTGQLVGWMYDPENDKGDNYIDFRVTPARRVLEPAKAHLTNADGTDIYGKESVELLQFPERNCGFLLDFNVDGSILNKVNWPDQI